MLYIRADGNTEIGMGHIMRCLSVAEAAADIGLETVFITADEGCRDMIEDRGFRVIVLGTDYRDMMGELSLLEGILCSNNDKYNNVVLVDSYQADSEYYVGLKKLLDKCTITCFDDMGVPYPVDLLINYNIYAPNLAQNYRPSPADSAKADKYPDGVLLGVEYMPLRKAFQKPSEYKVSDKVTNVTITTGGSDPYFASAAMADAILNDEFITGYNIHLHIVSGLFNSFAKELRNRYEARDNVTIHENVRDMRSLLLESDVVVTATGSTIYEVSVLGVPMIVFYFAENQRQGAEALGKLTDIVNAGCFAEDKNAVADKVAGALRRCIKDKEYRERLNAQETALIDGKGAARIAETLQSIGLK